MYLNPLLPEFGGPRFDSWQTEAKKEPYRCAVYIHVYLSGSGDASDRGGGSIQLFSHSKKIVL